MKKILMLATAMVLLSACAFNAKQPVDETYYKKTQSVAWPDAQTSAPTRVAAAGGATGSVTGTTGSHASGSIPSGNGVNPDEKWEDATAPVKKVAVPDAVKKKLECKKKGQESDTYTCRWGGRICGWGCHSDGSKCSSGYCLQSDCDDVMGQKWDWIEWKPFSSQYDRRFVCKHPDYPVACFPAGSDGIVCEEKGYNWRGGYETCGWQCNKNGTECQEGRNNCWDQWR